MRFVLILLFGFFFIKSYSQTKEEISWIKENSREIKNDNSDFTFLDSLLKNKRIVMIGENTHGSSEYFILKNKMIQYLHEKLGFNILSWESSLIDCYAVESQKQNLTPEQMANNSLHFVYRTEQVLPLMAYIKNSNLILTGFDSQPTVYSDKTANFLKQNPCLGETEFYYIDSLAQTPSKYSWKNRNRKMLAEKYQSIYDHLENSPCDKDYEVIKIGLKDRINDMINRNKGRDERMTNNLLWLLYKKYPSEKFIIYAHNAHIDKENQKNHYANWKTMAEYLPDSVIKQSYVIGIFGYKGQARDNIGKNPLYDFKEHPELSLENYLHHSDYGITFLDIENQKKQNANSFLYKEINTLYWGKFNDMKILAEHYDGVILVNEITPSNKLKKR